MGKGLTGEAERSRAKKTYPTKTERRYKGKHISLWLRRKWREKTSISFTVRFTYLTESCVVGNSKGWKKAATFFDMHIIHSPRQFLVIMSIWHLGTISSDSVLSLDHVFRVDISPLYFRKIVHLGKYYFVTPSLFSSLLPLWQQFFCITCSRALCKNIFG